MIDGNVRHQAPSHSAKLHLLFHKQHSLGSKVAFDNGGCNDTLALHWLANHRERNCDPCRQLPLQRKQSAFVG